jgi:AcrR family transcriptional regulator
MKRPCELTLEARKKPHQARATATVEAIFEATIQVLLAFGPSRLTTTRVAERAGVSVGTLYQYFPNKQALLFALIQRHLSEVAEALELACKRYSGLRLGAISDGLVAAYLEAKTRHLEGTRALYAITYELDNGADLVGSAARRIQAAITPLLASASDASFADVARVGFALRAALAGTVRTVLERGATPASLAMLRSELPRICRAYLLTAAISRSNE